MPSLCACATIWSARVLFPTLKTPLISVIFLVGIPPPRILFSWLKPVGIHVSSAYGLLSALNTLMSSSTLLASTHELCPASASSSVPLRPLRNPYHSRKSTYSPIPLNLSYPQFTMTWLLTQMICSCIVGDRDKRGLSGLGWNTP